MRRDRTDYLTWGAIIVLAVSLVLLLWGRGGEDAVGARGGGTAPAVEDQEQRDLEKFLGHYPPLPDDGERLAYFLSSHPGNSLAHLHRGELAYRQGKLAAAAGSLRRALELNRSFADAKSSFYRGEIIGRVVDEGLKVYLRERTLRPEDEEVKRTVKDLYFIQRSMGGGCD